MIEQQQMFLYKQDDQLLAAIKQQQQRQQQELGGVKGEFKFDGSMPLPQLMAPAPRGEAIRQPHPQQQQQQQHNHSNRVFAKRKWLLVRKM